MIAHIVAGARVEHATFLCVRDAFLPAEITAYGFKISNGSLGGTLTKSIVLAVLISVGTCFAVECPVTIQKVSRGPGEGEDGQAFFVHIKNTTDKTVTSVKLSSQFYDATHDPSQLPAVGMFEEKVSPGKEKKLWWRFDAEYSRQFPSWKSATVDVEKLTFADGSVWEDQKHECSAQWSRK